MSRPKKTFSEKDINQIEQLASCHCTDEEIATFMGCSETTLKRRFGPVLVAARQKGRVNIRAMQYKVAMKGNASMLIFLGKQLLGQSEKKTITVDDADGFEFEYKDG